jgi:hypothetical protein
VNETSASGSGQAGSEGTAQPDERPVTPPAPSGEPLVTPPTPGTAPPEPASMFEFAPERAGQPESVRTTAPRPLAVYVPPASDKPRTEPIFVILGFFSPFLLFWLLSVAAPFMNPFGVGIPAAVVLAMLTFLILLLTGRARGHYRLASFGKGGLWGLALIALLLLLIFGTCLASLGNSGN